jgi:hypothetical protein
MRSARTTQAPHGNTLSRALYYSPETAGQSRNSRRNTRCLRTEKHSPDGFQNRAKVRDSSPRGALHREQRRVHNYAGLCDCREAWTWSESVVRDGSIFRNGVADGGEVVLLGQVRKMLTPLAEALTSHYPLAKGVDLGCQSVLRHHP